MVSTRQQLLTRVGDNVAPWTINWSECGVTCPVLDVGPGRGFDPAKIP
jgi:hypothetical protein